MKKILSTTLLGCLLVGCTETSPLASASSEDSTSTRDYPTNQIKCGSYSYEINEETYTMDKSYYLDRINEAIRSNPDNYKEFELHTVNNCEEAKKYISFKNSNVNNNLVFEQNNNITAPREERETPSLMLKKSENTVSIKGSSSIVFTTEQRGVIQLPGTPGCTGVMINKNYALTAATCVEHLNTAKDFWSTIGTIRYFDPYDASSTPRTIKSSSLYTKVRILPTYSGHLDHQDNLALIYNPYGWSNTSNRDYQRIHHDATWKVHYNTFYGQGYNYFAGTGNGTLRKTNINWRWSSKYLAEATTTNARTCHGDVGGPYIANSIYGGWNMITGIHSSQSVSDNGTKNCGEYGGSIKVATLSSRIGWFEQQMGFTCNSYSQLSTDGRTTNNYKRCW